MIGDGVVVVVVVVVMKGRDSLRWRKNEYLRKVRTDEEDRPTTVKPNPRVKKKGKK